MTEIHFLAALEAGSLNQGVGSFGFFRGLALWLADGCTFAYLCPHAAFFLGTCTSESLCVHPGSPKDLP